MYYCKYYLQGIVVFLVSNWQVDSKLLADNSLTVSYYTCNYKDHWDPGCLHVTHYFINFIKGLCISTSYRVLAIHKYLITVFAYDPKWFLLTLWLKMSSKSEGLELHPNLFHITYISNPPFTWPTILAFLHNFFVGLLFPILMTLFTGHVNNKFLLAKLRNFYSSFTFLNEQFFPNREVAAERQNLTEKWMCYFFQVGPYSSSTFLHQNYFRVSVLLRCSLWINKK